MEEQIAVAEKPEASSRPAPTGVDLLHSLFEKIAAQELRIQELERHKHTDHTIPPETLKAITETVIARVVELLIPKSTEPVKQE